jgi:hypothetical protein
MQKFAESYHKAESRQFLTLQQAASLLIVPDHGRKRMRAVFGIALLALSLSACRSVGSSPAGQNKIGGGLSEDEVHRLYSAALAASESPLDSDLFKTVCQKVGIFDANNRPNDRYMAFVARHVDWSAQAETETFRHEINTREKARDYLNRHLPQ